jgi:hypothetical protein
MRERLEGRTHHRRAFILKIIFVLFVRERCGIRIQFIADPHAQKPTIPSASQ